MELLAFIVNQIKEADDINLQDIVNIIKDVVTMFAVLVGLYYGRKGIKRYLLDDIVKDKIKELHITNGKVAKVTKDVISELNSLKDLNRPLKKEDLDYFNNLTQKLVDISTDASKEVATFCFFLNETIKNVEVSAATKTYKEIRIAQDIYMLIYQTCIKVNQFASNIVDLPKRIKLEPYNEINKTIRKYLKDDSTYKISGIKFGINLESNSYLSLLFSSIINRTTHGYIYKKNFLQLLGDNKPIVYELFVNKIYFPVILETQDEKPIMGNSTLHLIRFEMKQSIIPDNKSQTVEFYYSNLDPTIKFINALKLDEISENFIDKFFDTISVNKDDIKVSKLADETIKIICDRDVVEGYFKKIEKQFLKKIKELKKNS